MKHILTLIAGTILVGTNISFSQTPEAPAEVAWAIKPLELPADNVELVSTDGRKLTAPVLSKDAKGIIIRKADGTEHFVESEKLSSETLEKINGKKSVAPVEDSYTKKMKDKLEKAKLELNQLETHKPQTEAEAKINTIKMERMKWGIHYIEVLLNSETPKEQDFAWKREGFKIPVREIQNKLVNSPNTDIIHCQIGIKNLSWELTLEGLEQDPNWDKFNLTPFDLLPKLKIKPVGEPETVNLKDKCKELGVKPFKQIGETCALYATQHLLQYACLSAGIKTPSVEAVKTAYKKPTVIGRYSEGRIWDTIPEVVGKRPITQWIGVRTISSKSFIEFNLGKPVSHEMAKQEIRDGRPVLADIGAHIVVLVGFEAFPNGKTRWTFLDSNGLDRDEGYHTIQGEAVTPLYSIRFE